MEIYDYLYVDLEKVISVYSQMTGGVVEVLERSAESSRSADNKRNYDFKVFKHDAGGTELEKGMFKETIKPHHALLKEMEEALTKQGFLVDLTNPDLARSLRDSSFRTTLKNSFCIKVKGRAVIEDYERLKSISVAFPEVVKFVNKSAESNLVKSGPYVDLKARIDEVSKELKLVKDRNLRANKEQSLNGLKKMMEDVVAKSAKVDLVDQWVLDGMRTWIDAYLAEIVNLRIYPVADRPDEHIFGHLKKQCFEGKDTNSMHFTYGSFPTEELTIIGIISSVPAEEGELFRPLVEFEKDSLADYEIVERAFRGVFRGFDGFERLIRTCRFPRVLVYPLTVYRSVTASASAKK